MISDRQARKVIELMQTEPTKAIAAVKAGMSERTTRKWARSGRLPSEVKIAHTWRTREDPFEGVRDRIRPMFELNPGLEAKTEFRYLIAVIDWFNRCVLAWGISNTQDADFCVRVLKKALRRGTPKIFNSDQGAQFTSEAFLQSLLDAKIAISMDGRGRAPDNVFVERLWRNVKFKNVYLHNYETAVALLAGLSTYFEFNNN